MTSLFSTVLEAEMEISPVQMVSSYSNRGYHKRNYEVIKKLTTTEIGVSNSSICERQADFVAFLNYHNSKIDATRSPGLQIAPCVQQLLNAVWLGRKGAQLDSKEDI